MKPLSFAALVCSLALECVAYQDNVLHDLGCWRDTNDRAIPSIDNQLVGPYASRTNAIHKCAHAARILGYRVFAVQDGGWCASGPNAAKTYKKYGPYNQCKSGGKGGPWANQVYEIDTVIKVSYRPVGCFKDQSDRAINPIETRFVHLHGSYHSRIDAIGKCARSAASLDHKVFALQDGGWCATAPNAHQTYKKYGYSQDCRQDGEGGPWANAVYEITNVTEIKLTRLGCYRDTEDRALPFLERPEVLPGKYHERPDAIGQCVRYASGFGFMVVGIQNGGCCMAGTNYARYGPSTSCKSDSKGGPWANEVFRLSVFVKKIPSPVLPMHRHFHLYNLGCWTDKEIRAIPVALEGQPILLGKYQSRKDAVQRCAQVAAQRGFDIIGVQHGGQCWSGIHAKNTYYKYGVSSKCEKDGEGGAWSNQVYEIGNILDPIFTGLGCYKDTPSRSIPLIENTQPIISDGYQKRSDALRKCSLAAARLGYEIFGVQNGGHCQSSPHVGSYYSKYGPADNCGNGRGGAWSNSVYQILDSVNFTIEDRGCWADDAYRTIPSVEEENPEFLAHKEYRTREGAVAKCARFAFSRGFKIFALQHGGWCATSAEAEVKYRRLGPSLNCGGDGKGGPWANQVYAIVRRGQ